MAIYIVRAVGTPRVKIGRTKNVRRRIASLQTGCPYPIELLNEIKTKGCGSVIEGHIHRAFDRYRVLGEWFELPDKALTFLSAATLKDIISLEIAQFLESKDLSVIMPESKVDGIRQNMKEVLRGAGI